jgi:ubiquinone/menaquinone biosynthesis C-methylase UbiE
MSIKTSLGHHLERWPALYSLAVRIYFALKPVHLKELIVGTKAREEEWATRHLRRNKRDDWGNAGGDWIKSYWNSQNHSHRPFLIDKISTLSPISSILEIGCNCGPNLYLLAKKFPDAEIRGIDINPIAVQRGNEWFAQDGIKNVQLMVGKADELAQFKDRSFDIVFTDAVLIYIGPDKIKKVIKGMLRITGKALTLLEWHSFGRAADPRGVYVGHWMRDYISLLKEFVPQEDVHVTKIPEELWEDKYWQRYGGIVEVDLENQSRKTEELTHK